MKKILVLVMVALATATGSFAKSPVKYESLYKLNNESTFKSMSRYLNISDKQENDLMYTFAKTESKLKKALKNADYAAADKAVKYNLINAKEVLTDIQYKQYVSVVNVSLYRDSYEMIPENNIK